MCRPNVASLCKCLETMETITIYLVSRRERTRAFDSRDLLLASSSMANNGRLSRINGGGQTVGRKLLSGEISDEKIFARAKR